LASTRDIMAGSATPLHIGVQNVAKFDICSLGEAINMATLHPAELFGLVDQGIGKLEAGSPADLIIYEQTEDHSWTILETVAGGETVYEL
jgi:N-acetylglucosamine-6-phosphate deacetylase